MVKHIVLFKLKENLLIEEKKQIFEHFKSAIEALPQQIPSICKIQVATNCNPSEDWDIVLESEFKSLDDVRLYATHPAHLAAGAILKEVKLNRACVDYEY
ncbi:MAG: Dabb family protein [Bacteroidaceae bacterium]|nr:Dabb family protein [Bacteroidaceae bacterium]